MKKQDGRSLDRKAPEAIHIRAVQQVEAGESPEDVIQVLGFGRTVIYDWLAKYREGGIDARAPSRTGSAAPLDGQAIAMVVQDVDDQEFVSDEV